MQKIIQGVRRFQQEEFPRQRDFFQHLTENPQRPMALFITCSDSRIHPNMLTQTEPGELFLLRNAGNIIPPYGTNCGGEGATIEYAVSVLEVKHIIICGHWHCGAMKSLLHNEKLNELPAVAAWFAHAEATRRIVKGKYAHLEGEELQAAAAEQNVLVQLGNLRTHPSVAAGMSRGEVQLHGWVYRIETGEVFQYDPGIGSFASLSQRSGTPQVSTGSPLPVTIAS